MPSEINFWKRGQGFKSAMVFRNLAERLADSGIHLTAVFLMFIFHT